MNNKIKNNLTLLNFINRFVKAIQTENLHDNQE